MNQRERKIRARRAESAMEAYTYASVGADRDSVLVDMLTDLRHYCALNKQDFESALRTSAMHFEAEAA